MIRTSAAIQNNRHSISAELLGALVINTFNINITVSFAPVATANQSISATANLNISATVNSSISATTNSNPSAKPASSLVGSKANNADIGNDGDEEEEMSTSVADIVQKKKAKRQRSAARRLGRSKLIDEEAKESGALEGMDDDISEENHKRRKTAGTGIKGDKALKPETKDEDSDGLLSDSRLSQLRFRGLSSTQELKDVEVLLRFARSSDNQVYELFQRIGTFLTDLDGCAMSAAGKAATDELVSTYRT